MTIYTKIGDKGETRVFDPKTKKLVAISKSSKKIETIGTIDELNSLLGVVGGLVDIQSDLFTINAILAGTKLSFGGAKTKKLEKEIERLEKVLPVQKNFIYYQGDSKATLLFLARSVARRAERCLVSLSKEEKISGTILMYLNRLSDYLFIKAREMNFESNFKEKAWMGKTF
jgi:cob(I)alamin adenosyltransferase